VARTRCTPGGKMWPVVQPRDSQHHRRGTAGPRRSAPIVTPRMPPPPDTRFRSRDVSAPPAIGGPPSLALVISASFGDARPNHERVWS
jgi:hypothetical protein